MGWLRVLSFADATPPVYKTNIAAAYKKDAIVVRRRWPI